MATMIVKHRVASFDEWKKTFDAMAETRKRFGWLGHQLLVDASDPNLVTIVGQLKDVASGKAYGGSPELKAGMQKAGVISAPEVTFHEDAENRTY